MAKDKISDYSSTANSNTDIAGINIDEGCAPSGINDAIRTLMAQLKTWQSGGQDIYIHPAGSASAPSITANGDTNTGVFFPAADTVGISTGGTERARVDSSGNLGLGVTPSSWSATYRALQIGGSVGLWGGASSELTILSSNAYLGGSGYARIIAGYATRYTQNVGIHTWSTAATSTAGSSITWTDAMTLDASGNLGVGATSPSAKLHVVGTTLSYATQSQIWDGATGTYATFRYNGTAVGDLGTGNQTFSGGSTGDFALTSRSGNLVFGTNTTERARIDSSGNLLIGKQSASATSGDGFWFSPDGQGYVTSSYTTNSALTWRVYSTGAAAYRFYVGYGGTVYATSTTITAISDQRLKENIRDLDDGLNVVMALKPRKFDWKAGKGQDIKDARGFIAQEFEQVLPDMVENWADPAPEGEEPYKAINANLIPTLVKALQEMKAIIDDQAARISALEAK